MAVLVITHNSGEGIMGERKNREQGESCEGLEESLQAAEQDVGSIEIRSALELAAKAPQPLHRQRRPRLHEVKDQLGCQQHQSEEAAHAFEGPHLDVFHIQALLLIKAIALFNAPTQAPDAFHFLQK
jgi:hypothetical protein